MCRVLVYLGERIHPINVLFHPDNSLIKQSYQPKLMSIIQNLAGFGMMVWDHQTNKEGEPFIYKTTELPFYDQNLKELAQKFYSDCVFAHVRGTEYEFAQVINQQNVHPFMFAKNGLGFAHNGNLAGERKIRMELVKYVKPEIFEEINGTTDSELMFAILLSRLPDYTKKDIPYEEIKGALLELLDILRFVRLKHKIVSSSPLNFFISNGNYIIALRYTMDYGWSQPQYPQRLISFHSMWYSFGKTYDFYNGQYQMLPDPEKVQRSVIISSEPLTCDNTTWLEIPEYSIFYATKNANCVEISIEDMPF